jgi:RimJ/RimL family protein N-acetyltransferase
MTSPILGIQLINFDDATIDLIVADLAAFESRHHVIADPCRDLVIETARQFRQFWGYTGDQACWAGYLCLDTESRAAVGNGGFKGPPSPDGMVEIGYSMFPTYEGKGYASALARALIDIAWGAPKVRRVIAHTEPGNAASQRVLAKIGMQKTGEIDDPEDGRMWRWEITR